MLQMMILQLYDEDDNVVQNFRLLIDVVDNVPKDDVDDASSLLVMMLCTTTPVVVVVSRIPFLLRGSVEINVLKLGLGIGRGSTRTRQ